MTASNMIEIPKELFARMILGLELLTKELLEEIGDPLLLEDAQQWTPEATDEEIERSFDAYR